MGSKASAARACNKNRRGHLTAPVFIANKSCIQPHRAALCRCQEKILLSASTRRKINRIFLLSSGKQNICSFVFYTDGTYRCRALYCGGSGSLDGISCRCGGKPFDSGTWTGGIPDFCRFFISTGFCIFSCSCTVDDKNLQRRGKYLEETGKSNKNLFSDRSDRNDSVSFRCCF